MSWLTCFLIADCPITEVPLHIQILIKRHRNKDKASFELFNRLLHEVVENNITFHDNLNFYSMYMLEFRLNKTRLLSTND